MNAKYFVLAFFSLFLPFTLATLGLAMWLEPFEGDLTRIGGKSENHFGWTQPQASFPSNLNQYHAIKDDHYRGDADIVVFGDSYSHMGIDDQRRFGWQNFLTAATGLTVFTYHVGNVDIQEWLTQQPPDQLPRFIIFQRAERRLSEYRSERTDCQPQFPQVDLAQVELMAPSLASVQYQRPLSAKQPLATAIHWLKINTDPDKEVLVRDLLQPSLFSHQQQQQILLLAGDYLTSEKHRAEADPAQVVCFLETLRQQVAANGYSQLIVAPAPDKYTVYQPVIDNASQAANLFTQLTDAGLNLAPIDQLFQNHLSASLPDLYLPNDTHWGSDGNRLYASIIAALINAHDRH